MTARPPRPLPEVVSMPPLYYIAAMFLGVPYVYGGGATGTTVLGAPSPLDPADTSARVWGFDCSGFALSLLRHAGYRLPPGSDFSAKGLAQLTSAAPSWEPGDLLFYGTPPAYHHVAVYVGGGYLAEAAGGGRLTFGRDPGAHVRFRTVADRIRGATYLGRLRPEFAQPPEAAVHLSQVATASGASWPPQVATLQLALGFPWLTDTDRAALRHRLSMFERLPRVTS